MAYNNNFIHQPSGNPHSILGTQAAFVPDASDFPAFSDVSSQNNATNSQQQENLGGMTAPIQDNLMKADSAEFNPFAMPGAKEQFPDLDQAFGAG